MCRLFRLPCGLPNKYICMGHICRDATHGMPWHLLLCLRTRGWVNGNSPRYVACRPNPCRYVYEDSVHPLCIVSFSAQAFFDIFQGLFDVLYQDGNRFNIVLFVSVFNILILFNFLWNNSCCPQPNFSIMAYSHCLAHSPQLPGSNGFKGKAYGRRPKFLCQIWQFHESKGNRLGRIRSKILFWETIWVLQPLKYLIDKIWMTWSWHHEKIWLASQVRWTCCYGRIRLGARVTWTCHLKNLG